MIKQLQKFEIHRSDIEKFTTFKSRDGFVIIDDNEFTEMLNYFKQFPVYKNIIPIVTDEQSNYWCLYITCPMKGMVCHLDHDEISLEPKFKNISNFISAIENNNEVYDFYEFDDSVFDFPSTKDFGEFTERKKIIDQLSTDLKRQIDKQQIQQLAFSIMALTSSDEIESNIYPFLESEDMWIQERVIRMLGFHKYKPARGKLTELTTTAMHNGKLAVKNALETIEQM